MASLAKPGRDGALRRPRRRAQRQAAEPEEQGARLTTLVPPSAPLRAGTAQRATPTVKRRPLVLIFMGVAGSGKTTVAKLFAKKTGASFYEGDDFHPPRNITKMSAGIALTDADRKQWLLALRKIIRQALAKKEFSVLTCSALKAKYRDALAKKNSCVKFVHLTGSQSLIAERLKKRRGHFLPPALLASQFAILEPPTDALVFNCGAATKKIVAELIQILGSGVSD